MRNTSKSSSSFKYISNRHQSGKSNSKEKKIMKLTEKSNEVFEYVKNNGGKITVEEICEAVGRTSRSVNANINDLAKKELVVREKVKADSDDEKDITYVVITDAGKSFVPTEE